MLLKAAVRAHEGISRTLLSEEWRKDAGCVTWLLEHIRCPKIQFPCNHVFKFTKQNEKAGNYRKKTTWLIFELSSEIQSEETDSKGSSSLAFSICSVNFHFKINISTASLHNNSTMASKQADDRPSDHSTLRRSVIREICHLFNARWPRGQR